jgi:hypothetical protein
LDTKDDETLGCRRQACSGDPYKTLPAGLKSPGARHSGEELTGSGKVNLDRPVGTALLLGCLARRDPVAEQQRQLMHLVGRAARTRFGRNHRFGEIRTAADFQAQVPLQRYEGMWTSYRQPAFPRLVDCTWPGTIRFFALTSGTTSGTTKYIPRSHEMNRANAWAAIDILVRHVARGDRNGG